MSQLPSCPNVSKGDCPRSDIVLAADQPQFYQFICRSCHLFWVWSKPRTKEKARYENELKRIEKATEADRIASARPKTFMAPSGGWTV